jgi:uncharacterized protein
MPAELPSLPPEAAGANRIADLLDWKRRVFEIYTRVRADSEPRRGWALWREARDELFRSHPQSPLSDEARSGFSGLEYFAYESAARVVASLSEAPPQRYEILTSTGGSFSFTRFAVATFPLDGETRELELYWLDGYGGGVFLPFRDDTSGGETYGAGRYLLDTVKGADLGMEGDRLILDFNFAYNPSCAYDPRWACPLAPPPNRLPVRIEAGEKTPASIQQENL